jgi:hypothetical protein
VILKKRDLASANHKGDVIKRRPTMAQNLNKKVKVDTYYKEPVVQDQILDLQKQKEAEVKINENLQSLKDIYGDASANQ